MSHPHWESLRPEDIASVRKRDFASLAARYLQYVARGGLLGSLILLLLIGMIYYQDLLNWIPDQAPVVYVLATVFAYVITRSVHRTFIKEADLLFLTPVESRMPAYFWVTFKYNWFLQSIVVLALAFVFAPLYIDLVIQEQQSLWIYYLAPVVLKGWNLQSSWAVQRLRSEAWIMFHSVLRFILTISFLIWLFNGYSLLWLLVFAVALIAFYFWEQRIPTKHAINWLRLLEQEQQLENRFYSFCNAFIDMPHVESKVHRRSWIIMLFQSMPFRQQQSHRFLYIRTFFRAADYFPRFLRLTIIGAVVIYALDDAWGQWSVYLLFLYLVATQNQAVWVHHQRQFWMKRFPLPDGQDRQSMQWLMCLLLFFQSIFMSVPLWFQDVGTWSNSVALLAIGLAFSFVYSYGLLNRTLQKKSVAS